MLVLSDFAKRIDATAKRPLCCQLVLRGALVEALVEGRRRSVRRRNYDAGLDELVVAEGLVAVGTVYRRIVSLFTLWDAVRGAGCCEGGMGRCEAEEECGEAVHCADFSKRQFRRPGRGYREDSTDEVLLVL